MRSSAIALLAASLATLSLPGAGRRLVFPTARPGDTQVLHIEQFPLLQNGPRPFSFGLSAKAEGLDPSLAPDHRKFGMELRVDYMDGSRKWLVPKTFLDPSRPGWQTLADVFTPPRAVSNIVFYCRLATKGAAEFDGLFVDELPETPPHGPCSVRQADGLIVVENDFLKIDIDPARGGTVVSLVDKKTGQDYSSPDDSFRLLMDRFRSGGKSWKRSYSAEVAKSTPDGAEIVLKLTGPDGFQYVEIEKRIRISRDSSAMEVVHRFRNLPESMGEQVLEPWFKNSFVPRGATRQLHFLPTSTDVVTLGGSSGDMWPTNVVGGWVAAGDGVSRTLAAEFDYAHYSSSYLWLGGKDQYTAEWCFQPTAVAPGAAFETASAFYPVGGIARPDWCENGIAAAFAADGSLSVTIASSRNLVLSAELRAVMADGSRAAASRIMKAGPDGAVSWRTDVSAKNLKAVRLRLSSGGATVFEADRAFVPGFAYRPHRAKAKPAELKPFRLALSDAVKSPAEAFFKPYAGGRVKALFIVEIRQQREIVELMERMDLEAHTIRIGSNKNAGAWGMIECFGTYSYEDANRSLKHELEGDFDAIVVSGTLWNLVDKGNRAEILRKVAAGAGLVAVDAKDAIPAGYEPDAAGDEYVSGRIARDLLPFGADRVSAFSRDRSRAVLCSFRAFDGLTPFVAYDQQEPSFRYQDYSLGMVARALVWASRKDMPRTPGLVRSVEWVEPEPGFRIGHVRHSSPAGVVDWECTVERAPKPVRFASFAVEPGGETSGGPVRGAYRLAGGTGDVDVSLYDSFGRLLSRTRGVGGSFSLSAPEVRTAALDVVGELRVGGTLVDRRRAVAIRRPDVRQDEFAFAVGVESVSGRVKRYLHDFRLGLLRDLGVNQLRFWRVEPDATSRAFARGGFGVDYPIGSLRIGSRIFPKEFAEPYARTKDRKCLCRKPCLDDPEWTAQVASEAAKRIAATAKYAPVSYDCGDENSLTLWATPFDFCFGEHTLKAFREWLKTQYDGLAALNEAWGTDFASWESVVPDTTDEARARAKRTGRRAYGAWADHRRYMELAFCRFYRQLKEVMAKECPGVPLDMSGTQQPNGWTGMDMWLVGNVIDIPAAYDHCELAEIVRSFGHPLVKPWYGYGHSGAIQRYRVWHDAFRFRNFGISFYSGGSVLMPDYTVPTQVADIMDALKDLRAGGASLLRSLEADVEVLVHYSQASIHAAQIESFHPAFVAERERLVKRLNAIGVPYRFAAYAEIEEGLLDRTSARAIVLPRSVALSARECDALRRFAKRGGIVVGDAQTGIMDEHCRLLPKSPVADIVRKDCDLGREAKDGIRRFVFRSGRGLKGEYFGFVRALDAKGRGARDVSLESAADVYDLRAKRHLGRVARFSTDLAPGEASFFAALPYAVKGVSVAAPRSALPGERVELPFEVAADGGASSLHPVKVEVYRPDGALHQLYSGVSAAVGGKGRHSFRFALNDAPGVWRVVATDFISGMSACAGVNLRTERDK